MDIALELLDTFAFDYAYAALFPARPAPFDVADIGLGANATAQVFSSWQYKPSSFLFNLPPPPQAYLTSVPRDNLARQFVSLFLITW